MAVTKYFVNLLEYEDCDVRFTPSEMIHLVKTWRNGHETASHCSQCSKKLRFDALNFRVCCSKFFFKPGPSYAVRSLCVRTPGYRFALPNLLKTLAKKRIRFDQDFLILPDPIFWQVISTLVFEKVMKFVSSLPMTKRTKQVQPASKSGLFYRQIQEVPLNHGSLFKRSGGKNTFYRQIAFGKRVILSTRAMIVPAADLRPNEIVLPRRIHESFDVLGKWVLLNRMPSLQPENFVALKVVRVWDDEVFGLPLEIVGELGADFDGDECNLYIVPGLLAQVECATLLDSSAHMGSFTSGIKLDPCQDMLVAYHLFRDRIDFLPPLSRGNEAISLKRRFRTVYDLYGSRATFECFDAMREFYLRVLQSERAFGISLAEIRRLVELGGGKRYATFEREVEARESGCLVTQVKAEAKGSFYHLFQMFGSVGEKGESSFWEGLDPDEAVEHALASYDGLLKSSNIWQPGYGYSKSVYNLQSLHVDYLGRLVDGGLVLENDVLDALHHTDLMSEDSFVELIDMVLVNS